MEGGREWFFSSLGHCRERRSLRCACSTQPLTSSPWHMCSFPPGEFFSPSDTCFYFCLRCSCLFLGSHVTDHLSPWHIFSFANFSMPSIWLLWTLNVQEPILSVYDNFAYFYSYSVWVGFTAELSEAILIFTPWGSISSLSPCPGHMICISRTSSRKPSYLLVLQGSVFFELFICFSFSSHFPFIEKINKY